MHSSNEEQLKPAMRLRTEIFTVKTLKACFKQLGLHEADLVITNAFLIKQINDTDALHGAALLNLDAYGSGEPKEGWVDQVLAKANERTYQRVIAIGGGTTIDIAKLCIFGDGRTVKELYKDPAVLVKKRKLIALPTTCGTGSETTSVSVVEFEELNSKLGLQIDALFPDQAFLVSELLQTLPYHTYAITSIDALAHAVESLLSVKATAYTDMFARTAIEGILQGFLEIRREHCLPQDMQTCLVSANMAGIAFSMAGCATMHALSFPLGTSYHMTHGEAVYAVFGSVLDAYRRLGITLHKLEAVLQPILGDESVSRLLQLLHDVTPCPDFKALGITEQECEEMALSVCEHQQRLLVNAPRTLSSTELAMIYKHCLHGGCI